MAQAILNFNYTIKKQWINAQLPKLRLEKWKKEPKSKNLQTSIPQWSHQLGFPSLWIGWTKYRLYVKNYIILPKLDTQIINMTRKVE